MCFYELICNLNYKYKSENKTILVSFSPSILPCHGVTFKYISCFRVLSSVRQNAVRTSPDFAGLPRTFTSFCGNYAR